MTKKDPAARSRLQRLGPIRRARGYRLYNHRGQRYLDLWQSGGRALLGHRPDRSLAQGKGAISRAPNAGLPSVYEKRLLGRLQRLVPGFEPLLTGSDAEVQVVLQHLGIDEQDIYDPAFDKGTADAYAAGIWRPFIGPDRPSNNWRVVIPILPATLGQSPAPVCLLPEAVTADLTALLEPASQPAAILVAGLAGLDRLSRYGGATWAREMWSDLESLDGWERRGPYVAARCDPEAYDSVFDQFLEAGFLLSPVYPGPSILPDEVSTGEATALMRLFAGVAGPSDESFITER